jgi:hypothetical protein
MALEGGSYESKLLRLLIGFFHVSLLQQLSLTRHNKPFHLLTQEEKTSLENEMLAAVMNIANQVSEEALVGMLKPPTVN